MNSTSVKKKREELIELIENIEIAMLTTRRPDGLLVSRPMATQKTEPDGDLWFVTNIETLKVDEIEAHPHVNLAYVKDGDMEWVSVSGRARVSQDREQIRSLHERDWKAWFEDEGGERNGGPDDPRLALILVEPITAHYMKSRYSRPRVLFEIAQARLTGDTPDVAREETLTARQLESGT